MTIYHQTLERFLICLIDVSIPEGVELGLLRLVSAASTSNMVSMSSFWPGHGDKFLALNSWKDFCLQEGSQQMTLDLYPIRHRTSGSLTLFVCTFAYSYCAKFDLPIHYSQRFDPQYADTDFVRTACSCRRGGMPLWRGISEMCDSGARDEHLLMQRQECL